MTEPHHRPGLLRRAVTSTQPEARILRTAERAASPSRRSTTPRQAGRRLVDAAGQVTQRRRPATSDALTGELLLGAGIVAIRAVADYEPQSDGTLKGKIGHPKGQYGPLPILAGLIGTFFLLSFAAARGGLTARLAVIFGAVVVLALGMKSTSEMTTVAATFTSFGKAKVPAGDWQTSGGQSGAPVTASSDSSGTGASAS